MAEETDEPTVSLMSDQAREALIAELDFIEKLQGIVIEKLRGSAEQWREDRYFTYDIEDRIREAQQLRKQVCEMELGLRGDRYHY